MKKNKMLKLYVMDCGVYGSIVAIASSPQAARDLMKGQLNYSEKETIKEYEINEGLIFVNLGDT